MRIGLSLPQFRERAEAAIGVARRAEAVGLDGVFVFDHLWPLGQPDRPALQSTTLLGALAAETDRLVLGTLVARVRLVPDDVLVATLTTLHGLAGAGRFIAGVGTGDSANRPENEAYGIAFEPAAVRRAALIRCVLDLRQRGVTTWAGGLSAENRRIAAEEADGWNGWGLSVDKFAEMAAGQPCPTWAGQVLIGRDEDDAAAKSERYGDRPGLVHGTPGTLAAHFVGLAEAGATWAICAPLDVGTDEFVPDLVAMAADTCR